MKMKDRPRMHPETTITDKLLDISAWLFILVLWIFTLLNYQGLPETIPIHYNAAGKPDGFGDRSSILVLPVIATIVIIALTILNNFPHLFNYPIRITEKNARIQYTNATRMMRYLKIVLVFIFGIIVFNTVYNAKHGTEGLGTWFLPVTLVLIFLPLIYLTYQSFRARNAGK